MKSRDIFDIIARTLGLSVILYGLGHLLYGLLGATALVENKYGRYNAVTGVVEVIVGLLMMRGVIPIADIAFPPELAQPQNESNVGPDQPHDAKDKAHVP